MYCSVHILATNANKESKYHQKCLCKIKILADILSDFLNILLIDITTNSSISEGTLSFSYDGDDLETH